MLGLVVLLALATTATSIYCEPRNCYDGAA
jgi:hypothetical protein